MEDYRLAELGLSHLRDKPEELQKALDKLAADIRANLGDDDAAKPRLHKEYPSAIDDAGYVRLMVTNPAEKNDAPADVLQANVWLTVGAGERIFRAHATLKEVLATLSNVVEAYAQPKPVSLHRRVHEDGASYAWITFDKAARSLAFAMSDAHKRHAPAVSLPAAAFCAHVDRALAEWKKDNASASWLREVNAETRLDKLSASCRAQIP